MRIETFLLGMRIETFLLGILAAAGVDVYFNHQRIIAAPQVWETFIAQANREGWRDRDHRDDPRVN
jgi:hypothetical protein